MTTARPDTDPPHAPLEIDEAATKRDHDRTQAALDNTREGYGKTEKNEQDVVGGARGGDGGIVRNDT